MAPLPMDEFLSLEQAVERLRQSQREHERLLNLVREKITKLDESHWEVEEFQQNIVTITSQHAHIESRISDIIADTNILRNLISENKFYVQKEVENNNSCLKKIVKNTEKNEIEMQNIKAQQKFIIKIIVFVIVLIILIKIF